VPAHIAGHKQSALGHGFKRLERRHQFGQAHAVAGVAQHVQMM
jgi:hypothetical protein